jgi:ABC-2 type transport system ATP-binding protein
MMTELPLWSTQSVMASVTQAVQVEQLRKRYKDVVAVDGISFSQPAGTCLAVLGPNGAGKTTTVEILEGLRAADGGAVTVLGRSWSRDARWIRSKIGVQLQETRFQEKLTVRETLAMFRAFYRDGLQPDGLLETIGLTNKAAARIKTLSGGQQQRLALGCALVNQPELLFLDEPTTGLDPQARRRVWEVIDGFKQRGKTVLLTTHYMEEAERLADDLIIIDHGRIIATGSPDAVIGRLGAENVIEARQPDDERARPWPETSALAALPAVLEVRSVTGHLSVVVARVSQALPALLALLEQQGIVVDGLRTYRPTLEDVFVSLTGRSLRDE